MQPAKPIWPNARRIVCESAKRKPSVSCMDYDVCIHGSMHMLTVCVCVCVYVCVCVCVCA